MNSSPEYTAVCLDGTAPGPIAGRRTLALLSRQVLGSGGRTLDFGVICPRRGHYTPITACMACDACDGIRVGKDSSDNALICVLDPGEPAAVESSLPRHAGEVALAEIMTPHVFCVRGDLTAEALGSLLVEKRLRGAPVVDRLGRPIGIVSQTEVLQHLGGCRGSSTPPTVADIMLPIPFALPANASVARAAALLAFEHLPAVPVLAPSGQVIGIVSSHDIMTWVARSGGYVVDARI